MLEVKPIQTKEEQKEICKLCGIEFNPDCLAYGATENGRLLGVAQFRILGASAVIFDLANAVGVDDSGALEIAKKAAFAFVYSCGVKEIMLNSENEKHINLEEYFNSPCQHSN